MCLSKKRFIIVLLTTLFLLTFLIFTNAMVKSPESDGKLRIIVFGAHPDDCELKVGGMAALWAAKGHHVKFVSVTNGDVGHAVIAGGQLAKRREEEAKKVAKVLGITYEVLNIHDGELMPTLENRKTFVRLIREWKADIVIAHRPNDYHPDHRYTGVLMQDAAFMVTVRFFLTGIPRLANNPVFAYMSDLFQKPNPFEPDIVVPIDDVFEQKVEAIWNIESQIESLWATGNFENIVPIPKDPIERKKRLNSVHDLLATRDGSVAERYRNKLIELYGEQTGKNVRYAEAFEICEYGRQPTSEELKELFPYR